jgi:hypothetical protein
MKEGRSSRNEMGSLGTSNNNKKVVQCNGGPTFLTTQEYLNACSKREEAFNETRFE